MIASHQALAAVAVAVVFAATSSCARLPPSLASQTVPTAPRSADLDQRYVTDVQPLLKTYCHSCHGGSLPAARLDLTAFDTTGRVISAFDVWERLHGRLDRREMPPRSAAQPTDAERRTITDWFAALRAHEAERNAGDPGVVLARRLALAFQTNTTSVATLLLCRDISGMFYPFLPVTEAHHLLSHNDTSKEFTLVNQYYTGQLAYLAQRLQSMAEGDGTVLDNSCLLFMSNMWSGSRHDSTRVPVLTLGNLGGTLQSGRVLDYYDRPADTRRLCSLYLSLMDRMGVELRSFGDADERLAGI